MELHVRRSVGQAAELAGVSINSVLQNPILNPADIDFVVTTESARRSEVFSALHVLKNP